MQAANQAEKKPIPYWKPGLIGWTTLLLCVVLGLAVGVGADIGGFG